MVKVKPSAFAALSWKLKSVVKLCTLTGVEYQTALACTPPLVLVNCSVLLVTAALPMRLRPVEELKPVGSLTTGVVAALIVYKAEPTALVEWPLATAIASSVSEALTLMGLVLEKTEEAVVGVVPLVV